MSGFDPRQLAFFGVLGAWAALAVAMLIRRAAPTDAAPAVRRSRASLAGIVLQGCAFGLVWAVRRRLDATLLPGGAVLEQVLLAGAVLLAWCSAGLAVAAIRELGRQWSLEARLIEGHRLIVSGPYRLVRHPIYSAMLGLLIATGITQGHSVSLLLGVALYLAGTQIRVSQEEALLRTQFGGEFELYRRRVRAVLPLPR